jgi:hypothetical protein
MTTGACPDGIALDALVEYWLDDPGESSLEAHVFGCDACTAMLEWIAALGEEIPDIVRRGATMLVMPEALLERLRTLGAQLREYRIGPGGSVNCTIAPDDDVVVAHLEAPLAGVARIDLVGSSAAGVHRATDIPFDATRGTVVLASRSADLRALGHSTIVAQLLSVDVHGERELARYTFHHAPFDATAP